MPVAGTQSQKSPDAEYRDAEALLARLQQQPAAFAPDVKAVERIETHISWLLLAGDRVYKFKKPLRLDFLDYSTLALRRAACEEELRINRRTAPGIYLGLTAVTGSPEAPGLAPVETLAADTPVLEWAVCMRRFDQQALLSHLAHSGGLQSGHIDALARQVAAFHAAAAVAPPGSPWGRAERIRADVADNFGAVAPQVRGTALQTTLDAIEAWTLQTGASLATAFDERRVQGFVRECHGDLHLGNLVLIDGQPELFDAIEFNPAFRWVDVLSDAAFLVMDLQARGCAALAWRFLNGWLEHSGDYAGLRLLPWYLAYRAMVRAKVAALRLAQQGPADDEEPRAEMAQYLQLASRTIQPRPPVLWLVSGVSGSGKSSQTQSLVEALGLVRIKADVERKRLFGLAPLERSVGQVAGGIYTPEASRRTYERLEALARGLVQSGFAVLVDATFLQRAQRHAFMELAQALGVPCRILALDAPEAVLRDRVAQRARAGQDPSEADVAVLQAQLARREALDDDERACAVQVDSSQPVDWAAVLPPQWRDGL